MDGYFNLFTVLKKLKECVGFFFFNNLIATNVPRLNAVGDLEHKCLNLKINKIWNTEI